MAMVKIILESGASIEIDATSQQADDIVAAFARYVSEKRVPDKRLILTPSQSVYIDYSKVAIVRREF